jgi:hypothetical protein
VEWVITNDRKVVLSLDERLPSEPVRAEVTSRGTLLVETADGESHSFAAPNRKVAGALRHHPDIALTEPATPDAPRRTTVLGTEPPAPAPGVRR